MLRQQQRFRIFFFEQEVSLSHSTSIFSMSCMCASTKPHQTCTEVVKIGRTNSVRKTRTHINRMNLQFRVSWPTAVGAEF